MLPFSRRPMKWPESSCEENRRASIFFMVAEPANESAPYAPRRLFLPCRWMVLAHILLTIGIRVERQDYIVDKQEYTDIHPEKELTEDLEKKEPEAAVLEEDWCLEPLKALLPRWRMTTWIGTTTDSEEVSLHRIGTDGDCEEYAQSNGSAQVVWMNSSAQVEDWHLNLKKS